MQCFPYSDFITKNIPSHPTEIYVLASALCQQLVLRQLPNATAGFHRLREGLATVSQNVGWASCSIGYAQFRADYLPTSPEVPSHSAATKFLDQKWIDEEKNPLLLDAWLDLASFLIGISMPEPTLALPVWYLSIYIYNMYILIYIYIQ